MQVVRHHNGRETLIAKWPAPVDFQVGLHEAHAGNVLRVAVDGNHVQAARCEEPRMSSRTARDVEHRATLDERRPALNPLRWRFYSRGCAERQTTRSSPA